MVALLAAAGLTACGGDGETAAGGGGGATETTAPDGGSDRVSPKEGAMLFDSLGCGDCHTLAAADSSGTIGPNLDEVLAGESRSFIRESITDPNAEIAPGYTGIMPSFADDLSPEELESLVTFLEQSTGG